MEKGEISGHLGPIPAWAGSLAASLGVHIADVIEGGSEKQVTGINAATIIATMANQQFARLTPVSQRPSYAVSQKVRTAATETNARVTFNAVTGSLEATSLWIDMNTIGEADGDANASLFHDARKNRLGGLH